MLGTENKEVLILNPAGSAIVSKLVLPAVPVFMAITGTLDVEYRIAVACRDNNVYTIKVRVILAPPRRPYCCVACMTSSLPVTTEWRSDGRHH